MNELIQYAQSLIDFLANKGASLNIASQQALAELLQSILQIIESQEPTEALTPQAPQQPITPGMPSSNVEGFAYDDKTGKLLVRFLGDYPNREGPIYSYGGVPKVIFDLFKAGSVPARTDGQNRWGKWFKGKVPSLGASLFTLIKQGGYPYQKVS